MSSPIRPLQLPYQCPIAIKSENEVPSVLIAQLSTEGSELEIVIFQRLPWLLDFKD